MSFSRAIHHSFTLERVYPVTPGRVFMAWSDTRQKARWFAGPPDEWDLLERTMDFRVGGLERLKGTFAAGATTLYTARYHAIVADHRIAFTYDTHSDGTHLSCSLVVVDLSPHPSGTTLAYVEHAAFLDGTDRSEARERHAGGYLDRLGVALQRGQ